MERQGRLPRDGVVKRFRLKIYAAPFKPEIHDASWDEADDAYEEAYSHPEFAAMDDADMLAAVKKLRGWMRRHPEVRGLELRRSE